LQHLGEGNQLILSSNGKGTNVAKGNNFINLEMKKVEPNSSSVEANIKTNPLTADQLNTMIKTTFWSLLCEHKVALILSIFTLSGMGAVWPAYGMLLAGTFNGLGTPEEDVLRKNGLALALWYVLMAFMTALCFASSGYLLNYLGENITKKLRKQLFEKYLDFQMGYYDYNDHSPGAIISKLNQDTKNITGIALSMVGLAIQMIMSLLVGFCLSIAYSWKLCLIAVSLMPLTVLGTVFTWKSQKNTREARETIEKESGNVITDSISNMKIIFAYNMQKKVAKIYEHILVQFDKIIFKASIIHGISYGVVMLVMFVSFGILFYAGSTFIEDLSVTLDNMLKSIFTILFAIFGIAMGQQYVGDITKVKEAIADIISTINTKSEIPTNTGFNRSQNEMGLLKGKVEFRNVSFSYPTKTENLVLKNINFTITPGSCAAFIGFSGSGKSTIVQLIERFYDPNNGEIYIDDINVKEHDICNLRANMGLVMEEPIMFKRDVFENIKYGKLNGSEEEILNTADLALIRYYLTEDKKGIIVQPSGGEKQRIALSRALIKDPRILLLDEITSALDKNTEKEFIENFHRIKAGRTVVMIAHK
jgi:ATP-binding cassette subfamily B (MDR/TAP) protein 1